MQPDLGKQVVFCKSPRTIILPLPCSVMFPSVLLPPTFSLFCILEVHLLIKAPLEKLNRSKHVAEVVLWLLMTMDFFHGRGSDEEHATVISDHVLQVSIVFNVARSLGWRQTKMASSHYFQVLRSF